MRRFIRNEKGSLTLEAAMILPFFMLFIVFLANIIRIGIADMALYESMAETNEAFVAHAYPAEIIIIEASDLAEEKFNGLMEDNDFEIDVDFATDFLVDSLEDLGIETDPHAYLNTFLEFPVERVLQKKFYEKTGGSFFNPENLSVDRVDTPEDFSGNDAYLEINATYAIDINFPFVNRTIEIKKTSYERLWAGA